MCLARGGGSNGGSTSSKYLQIVASGDENMLNKRTDQCVKLSDVPTLEKNQLCKYEQLLPCVLTLKSPKG